MEYAIDQYIVGYLNCARDRDMLRRRLLDGVPLETLADEFNVSTAQAKQIIRTGVTTILERVAPL